MNATAIEWTDRTWNPVTGCSKVSAGCQNCYAEAISLRFKRSVGPWNAVNAAENVVLHPDRLALPLKWQKPARVFVNSMSDLFHEQVPDEFIERVFGIMALTPQHTYQILTKRPERMAAWLTRTDDLEDRATLVSRAAAHDGGIVWDARGSDEWKYSTVAGMPGRSGSKERAEHLAKRRVWPGWPLPNVWLGTSTEDQRTADERIPHLLATPAAVRFLSCEPLLGPVDLSRYIARCPSCSALHLGYCEDPVRWPLHWVITGGESGPRPRPIEADWARSLRDQCQAAGVPFFFKQWSGRNVKALGRELDGREWSQFPEAKGAPTCSA